ncbi:MAG: hypothetical protein H8E62_01805 [Planctomycetes bacterium]|nr:hypothetical protein [Planctomycetota bacterium]
MTIRKSITILFFICLAGCVPSLHQLWTSNTLIYDPTISGTWQQEEERWQFVGDLNDKSYELTVTEKKGKQSKLLVHLVEVDGQRFFDFYLPDDSEIEAGGWTKFHLLAVHSFYKVQKTESRFMVAAMEPDKVGKLLKDKPDMVKHEFIEEDRVVLTDTPENLQKFLMEGLKVEGFFGDPTDLTPIKEQ